MLQERNQKTDKQHRFAQEKATRVGTAQPFLMQKGSPSVLCTLGRGFKESSAVSP